MTEASLYERIGGSDAVDRIVDDIWINHTSNPKIKNRYQKSDPDAVKQKVREFIHTGFGGPLEYTGQDMLTAHTGMNISDEEFVAVCDDVLAACDKNRVAEKERGEVLIALYSMKNDIVAV